jgi:hypothetical protein
MTIHQRINAKGNASQMPAHFTESRAARERHAESIEGYSRYPMKMIKRGYSKMYDQWQGERIIYPQDQKTNHREPRDSYYDL